MALNTPTGQPSNNPDSDFRGASVPNRISYKFSDLDPGANIYIQRDDLIVVTFMSRLANEVVNMSARLLVPGREAGRTQPDPTTVDNPLGDSNEGLIQPITLSIASAGAYTQTTRTFQFAEGYLLSICLTATIATTRGMTFGRIGILRGGLVGGVINAQLVADYVYTQSPMGWPGGRNIEPTEGPGNMRIVNIANPAAGVDWSFPIQAGTRARIAHLQATLTTAIAVANRQVALRTSDATLVVDTGTYPGNQVLAASLTGLVTGAPDVPGTTLTPTDVNVAIPEPTILANNGQQAGVLKSVTTNIQAADQWSAINIMIEEWLDF